MRPSRSLTLAAACIAFGCGCSDADSPYASAPGDAGPPPDSAPAPPLPSSCSVPDLPAPLGHSAVVGDGTAESCTRDALQSAVENGGDVTFNCGPDPLVIPVDAEVVITEDTILDGGGTITLDGLGRARLITVENHISFTAIGLSFTRGFAVASYDGRASGGAIRGGWRGSVSAFDCVFVDNEAGYEGEEGGGALYVPSASNMMIVRGTFSQNRGGLGGAVHNLLSGLTIVNSTFTENVSDKGGGAVYTDGASAKTDDGVAGTIDICGCRFDGNRTKQTGGGAYLFAYAPDEVIINQCSFERNVVERTGDGGALGGGLRTGNAPLDIANSTFADNHADVHGGGLWVDAKYLTRLTNCTFLRNVAGVEGQEGGYGGAVSGGNIELLNVTMVENHADHSGGAIFNEKDESVSLRNSIVAFNTAANEWGLGQSCRDTMTGSHVIQWPVPDDNDASCVSNVIVEDPLIGELSDNGGPTMTIPLSGGSPAIDAGEGCAPTDQRGLPRTGACDLGSFEAQ